MYKGKVIDDDYFTIQFKLSGKRKKKDESNK